MNELETLTKLISLLRPVPCEKASPFVGKFVLVRSNEAGVHVGECESVSENFLVLRNAYRLWEWKAASGIALSGVAVHGIVHANSRVDSMVSLAEIGGRCEILVMTEAARATIRST